MLVVQQNCGKEYECTISALEAGLGLEASIVCIQEPFLGNRSLAHAGYNLYWPSGTDNRKDMRVLIAVRKDILTRKCNGNLKIFLHHPCGYFKFLYTAILFTSRNSSRQTAQPIVGKGQYDNKQLKNHFHDEYLQFFRMPRPCSDGAIVKLIEFEYFLGRRPSEILKTNPQLKKTTVYRICKTLERWGVPYPAQRLSIWGRPRKMTQEMVDSLVQLLAARSTYFLDELRYLSSVNISYGFQNRQFLVQKKK